MNDLDIWRKLPQKGYMYVYDDFEELAIKLYIIKQ